MERQGLVYKAQIVGEIWREGGRKREREREREIYIYIYIYIERERETEEQKPIEAER